MSEVGIPLIVVGAYSALRALSCLCLSLFSNARVEHVMSVVDEELIYSDRIGIAISLTTQAKGYEAQALTELGLSVFLCILGVSILLTGE